MAQSFNMVINMDIARSLRPLTIDVLTSTFGLTEGDLSNSRHHWVLLKITQVVPLFLVRLPA
jgi:hypothetical protein